MHSKLLGSILALAAVASDLACNRCGPDTVPQGAATLTWSITMADQRVTCAHAGATSVSLALHNRASGEDTSSAFACTDPQGTTSPLPVGTYDATITLRAVDGAPVATAPMQAAIPITLGQVTTLRPAMFAASDLGNLVLSLVTLEAASNCQPRSDGGAGTTGHVIELTHAAGGCAPVMFRRMRGETQVGTYTVDCSSPQVAPCIERDETLHALGLEPGPYAISVSALAATRQCGSGDDVVLIPANVSVIKPIQIAHVQNVGC